MKISLGFRFGVGVGIEPSTFHLGRQGLDMVISAMQLDTLKNKSCKKNSLE